MNTLARLSKHLIKDPSSFDELSLAFYRHFLHFLDGKTIQAFSVRYDLYTNGCVISLTLHPKKTRLFNEKQGKIIDKLHDVFDVFWSGHNIYSTYFDFSFYGTLNFELWENFNPHFSEDATAKRLQGYKIYESHIKGKPIEASPTLDLIYLDNNPNLLEIF